MERALIGFDYAQLGSALALEWNLPASLQSVIRHHNEPGKAEEFQLETSIAHIAHALTDAHSSEQILGDCKSRVAPFAWQMTNLSPEHCLSIKKDAVKGLLRLWSCFCLGAKSPDIARR